MGAGRQAFANHTSRSTPAGAVSLMRQTSERPSAVRCTDDDLSGLSQTIQEVAKGKMTLSPACKTDPMFLFMHAEHAKGIVEQCVQDTVHITTKCAGCFNHLSNTSNELKRSCAAMKGY